MGATGKEDEDMNTLWRVEIRYRSGPLITPFVNYYIESEDMTALEAISVGIEEWKKRGSWFSGNSEEGRVVGSGITPDMANDAEAECLVPGTHGALGRLVFAGEDRDE